DGAPARARDRVGGHPSVRHVGGPADRGALALPRPDRRPSLRRPPGADLRPARPRGGRRPRQGHPRGQRDEGARAAAARPVGELVDLPKNTRVRTRDLVSRVLDRAREHAKDLGSEAELAGIDDLLDRGNGATRLIVVYEANSDLREVVGEIVEKTAA